MASHALCSCDLALLLEIKALCELVGAYGIRHIGDLCVDYVVSQVNEIKVCVCVCVCVRVRARACMCARICVYSSTGVLAILRMLQVCARMVSPPLHNNIVILSYVMILCWHDTDCVTVK